MTISVFWDGDDKTVIRQEVSQKWSIEDFYLSIEQSNTLIETVKHPVHIIIDMSKSHSLPKGFISSLSSIQNKSHSRIDITIIVGANVLITAFSKLFAKLYPNRDLRFYMVSTLDEARKLLNEDHHNPYG